MVGVDIAVAYQISLLTISGKKSKIKLTDKCMYVHELVLDTENVNDDTVLPWIDELMNKNLLCKKSSVKILDK